MHTAQIEKIPSKAVNTNKPLKNKSGVQTVEPCVIKLIIASIINYSLQKLPPLFCHCLCNSEKCFTSVLRSVRCEYTPMLVIVFP